MKTLEGGVAGATARPARPDRGGDKSEGLRARVGPDWVTISAFAE